MKMSYQQLMAGVLRYKYLCDEGFRVELSSQHQLSWEDARAMERLAEQVVADTGMDWTVAMRGILYSVAADTVIRHGSFAAMHVRRTRSKVSA